MKRYHVTPGMGTGLGGFWGGGDTTIMHEAEHGFWVLHEEALAFANDEFNRGMASKPVDRSAHYTTLPYSNAAVIDEASRDDSDRKRLLNELYHDRARLERVVDDACQLVERLTDFIAGVPLEDEHGNDMDCNDQREFVMGNGQQFVDTHQGD